MSKEKGTIKLAKKGEGYYHKSEEAIRMEAMKKEDKWVCPKCGDVDGNVEITIPPYSGHYCIKCYSRWINENIPKVKKK